MKPLGTHKTIGTTSAGVLLVLAGTVAWLVNMPPTADCSDEAPANHKVHEIRATKVVAHPWLGKHQVYGIFMVPNRYKDARRYSVTMSVQGFDGEFTTGRGPGKPYVEDVAAEPGYQVKRGYVPTRVALWLLFTGHFGDLHAPCNWTLVFIERAS
jgi:hypothetical protein